MSGRGLCAPGVAHNARIATLARNRVMTFMSSALPHRPRRRGSAEFISIALRVSASPRFVTVNGICRSTCIQIEGAGADAELVDLRAVLLRDGQHHVGELRALRRHEVTVAAE